jgi:hypothetical protein
MCTGASGSNGVRWWRCRLYCLRMSLRPTHRSLALSRCSCFYIVGIPRSMGMNMGQSQSKLQPFDGITECWLDTSRRQIRSKRCSCEPSIIYRNRLRKIIITAKMPRRIFTLLDMDQSGQQLTWGASDWLFIFAMSWRILVGGRQVREIRVAFGDTPF